jgi:hypothetical protein
LLRQGWRLSWLTYSHGGEAAAKRHENHDPAMVRFNLAQG